MVSAVVLKAAQKQCHMAPAVGYKVPSIRLSTTKIESFDPAQPEGQTASAITEASSAMESNIFADDFTA